MIDRNEPLSLFEPLLINQTSRHRGQLTDLAIDLASKAAGFKSSLPGGINTALADLVRSMNCYYSNLIEGHNTHPIDIERALKQDYSTEQEKRDLQLEAVAHVAVQQWIDEGGLSGRVTTLGGILEIHRRFYDRLPPSLLAAIDPDSGETLDVVGGQLRTRDVKIGRLIPVSPARIQDFMARFEQVYSHLGKTDQILAAAAAHHRLLWIHPFLDGNGRVARLMSHAMLLETLNTGGVWSVARGLARNEQQYKSLLMACDQTRKNDLVGRGNLSESALAEFTEFFLSVCIDQIDFMQSLVQPDRLRDRILIWAEEEMRGGRLPGKSDTILEAALYRGLLPRGEVTSLLDTSDRNARRVTSALLEREVLESPTSRSPLRLAFPASLIYRWMPGLFPEK